MGSAPTAPYAWYGGKQRLTRFLLPLVPETYTAYVEPYFGAGTMFWRLPPVKDEVINDLDEDLVTFLRVLQDPDDYPRLGSLAQTPFWSRAIHEESLRLLASGDLIDRVERAWRWFYVAKTSFGAKWDNGFQVGLGKSNKARTLASGIAKFPLLHARLLGIQIECRDGIEVIERFGRPGTFVYADPPYVHGTRVCKKAYRHEMADEQHERLVEALLRTEAMVLLSGYQDPVYEPLERAGWRRFERVSSSGNFRGKERLECAWTNYAIVDGGGVVAG